MNRDGFSLIEVVVALAVLGIGLGALLAGTAQAQHAARAASRLDEAMVVAEGLLTRAVAGELAPGQNGAVPVSGLRWSVAAEDPGLPGLTRMVVSIEDPQRRGRIQLAGLRADRSLPARSP